MNKHNQHVKESIDYFNHELECSNSGSQQRFQRIRRKLVTYILHNKRRMSGVLRLHEQKENSGYDYDLAGKLIKAREV